MTSSRVLSWWSCAPAWLWCPRAGVRNVNATTIGTTARHKRTAPGPRPRALFCSSGAGRSDGPATGSTPASEHVVGHHDDDGADRGDNDRGDVDAADVVATGD